MASVLRKSAGTNSPSPPTVPPDYDAGSMERAFQEHNGQFGLIEDELLFINFRTNTHTASGNLLVCSLSLFDIFLDDILPNILLSRAEKRTLVQIVCGYSLQQCAEMDNVSYETKRTQLKSVGRKTGLKKQLNLSLFVISNLMSRVDETDPGTATPFPELHKYHQDFLPDKVRIHHIVGPSARTFSVISMGADRGKPIIVSHGQLLPWIHNNEIDVLSRLGLKLIFPLRNGFLNANSEQLSARKHLEHALEGIQVASSLVLGNDSIQLLGLCSGGFYITEYIKRYPTQIEHAWYFGACFKKQYNSSWRHRFTQGITHLIARNPVAAKFVLSTMARKYSDREVFEQSFRRLFKLSSADTAVIDKEFGNPRNAESLYQRFSLSIDSIYHDFGISIHSNWDVLRDIPNIHFLHGSEDPLHASENIEILADKLNATYEELPGVGQLGYYQHFSSLLEAINKDL